MNCIYKISYRLFAIAIIISTYKIYKLPILTDLIQLDLCRTFKDLNLSFS